MRGTPEEYPKDTAQRLRWCIEAATKLVGTKTTTLDESKEQLGPVDTGRSRRWTHRAFNNHVALCGEVCGITRSDPRFDHNAPPCPDCLRIMWQMGLPT